MKLYMSDLVPGIKTHPEDRVAIMRKGGRVRLSDYCTGFPPPTVTVGLAWDVTDGAPDLRSPEIALTRDRTLRCRLWVVGGGAGVNIDLDASVIVLDANLRLLDIVFFGEPCMPMATPIHMDASANRHTHRHATSGPHIHSPSVISQRVWTCPLTGKLRSSDGAIQHSGDEREGDEKGDDEKIHVNLRQVHPAAAFLCVCINSYTGQELDDVKDAQCTHAYAWHGHACIHGLEHFRDAE